MSGVSNVVVETNTLPAGVLVGKAHWVWALPQRCHTLSSAAIGGGFGDRTHVVSRSVTKNWSCLDPLNDTRQWCAARGFPIETSVVLITSVYPRALRATSARCQEWCVTVLATAGVGNAAHPAHPPVTLPLAGTINLVAYVAGKLSDTALVGAVQTMTEAKSAALDAAGVRTTSGHPATGTTTDTVTVLTAGEAPVSHYAGLATPLGAALAAATLAAVSNSLKTSPAA